MATILLRVAPYLTNIINDVHIATILQKSSFWSTLHNPHQDTTTILQSTVRGWVTQLGWWEFWARPTHWVIISNLLGERIRDEYCVHLNVAISWFFLVNVFAILVNTWGAYPHAGKAKKARMQNRPFFVLLSPVYSILPLGRGRKYWLRWSNYRPWHFFFPSIIIHTLSSLSSKRELKLDIILWEMIDSSSNQWHKRGR